MCKEDPVVFIETVCGVELLEYQKAIVRKTFKALKRPDRSEIRTKCLCEPDGSIGTESAHVFFDEYTFDLTPSEPKAEFEKIYTDTLKALSGYNPNGDKRIVIDISKEVTCRTCKYRDGWHHLEPCCSCKDFSNWCKIYH